MVEQEQEINIVYTTKDDQYIIQNIDTKKYQSINSESQLKLQVQNNMLVGFWIELNNDSGHDDICISTQMLIPSYFENTQKIKTKLSDIELVKLEYQDNKISCLFSEKDNLYTTVWGSDQVLKISSNKESIINQATVYYETHHHLKEYTAETYINNILNSADNEFRQETWESLTAATQLYFETEDLLGSKPKTIDLITHYEQQGNQRTYEVMGKQEIANFFSAPNDTRLQGLWDTVQDRLFKLRHGLNIDGQVELPSDYGTPIDPRLVLLAEQKEGVNPTLSSVLQPIKPNYRFRDLLGITQSLIETTAQFGNQLYAVFQQKDNAQLEILNASHQIVLQQQIGQMYTDQIKAAQAEIDGVNTNIENSELQIEHYTSLLNKPVNALESASLALGVDTLALQIGASVSREAAVPAHLLPNIFGFSDGGMHFGAVFDSIAGALSEEAQALQTSSQLLDKLSEYKRRIEDWEFQLDMAHKTKQQFEASKAGAKIRLKIAKDNLAQYNLSLQQAADTLNYLKTKFTRVNLYNWMSGQLSSLYFTAYQHALGALHKLQKAYNYELGLKDGEKGDFIPQNTWNSKYKGLLAGETLKLALQQMQHSYLDNHKRLPTYVKSISVVHSKGIEFTASENEEKTNLEKLVAGERFSIQKVLGSAEENPSGFRIKSIAISIPSVMGPYETFDAKFSGDTESIIISRGINDYGVLPEEIHDGRYMPFEGLDPASCSWKCEGLSDFTDKISDFIIEIKYTKT